MKENVSITDPVLMVDPNLIEKTGGFAKDMTLRDHFAGTAAGEMILNTYKISTPLKPVGYWILYAEATHQTIFSMYYKPTPEQIEKTEKLLGWTWRDAE
jgi:hypothetical protein